MPRRVPVVLHLHIEQRFGARDDGLNDNLVANRFLLILVVDRISRFGVRRFLDEQIALQVGDTDNPSYFGVTRSSIAAGVALVFRVTTSGVLPSPPPVKEPITVPPTET
ncbi:MAG: hypothetical protein AUJ92_12125 [Armatimonadetes bacterium CG2_30_59_28]|nr:MAG: hypothetical protein AUJ92_12125 [Armatimonadetes bacterium CG2_30_59_28]PIU65821.1 MAG: hypothetical protein COS85_07315 [Armatimonadetes bacterium CG07_land_8_20_14_0_80_59_28]PIX42373.1 MAG: hypothetical protein COZ56_09540 [Armatimonadetes bacterium CG_4_8_14_3_um_filter_58_9]PIY49325.1 MAG: hypothetical protein COZ05_00745 [Armatimonadetes bacterium CG_4_10_14_3_um_filter_59_10]PJB66617.1 MAG: hypothetical protein CO095_12900 [Armatimonadetes bacterium CG_4_9_14_3_um_filter_58_7]